jgi:DNA-binding HxlR family transcriptional regulator
MPQRRLHRRTLRDVARLFLTSGPRYGFRTGGVGASRYRAPMHDPSPPRSYGQFCSIARALDLLGERWTLLVVRELLCGSRRFSDIQRGIPRISKTMLSARLKELLDAHVIAKEGADGYRLTPAGEELFAVVRELGTWGQRWLPRDLPKDELDLDTLAWDMHRRVSREVLPTAPVVARIEVSGSRARYLLLRRTEVSVCATNPGFPDELRVRSSLRTLTRWWRGDVSLAAARAEGLRIEGPRALVRAFPTWFERYLFADVAPAKAS